MSEAAISAAYCEVASLVGDDWGAYPERLDHEPRDVATLLLARARGMPR